MSLHEHEHMEYTLRVGKGIPAERESSTYKPQLISIFLFNFWVNLNGVIKFVTYQKQLLMPLERIQQISELSKSN